MGGGKEGVGSERWLWLRGVLVCGGGEDGAVRWLGQRGGWKGERG